MSKLIYFRKHHNANAVMASVAEVAASLGYVNAPGINPSAGNVAELLAAIAGGEVAVVKLDDEQVNFVVPWLATRAVPPELDAALFEIASALDEARERKATAQE